MNLQNLGKTHLGWLIFSLFLLWTVSVIFPTLLDCPLDAIMKDLDEYQRGIARDLWELPFYVVSVSLLAYVLPSLADGLKNNNFYDALTSIGKGYPKWGFYGLLIFVVCWILTRDSLVQYCVDYLSSIVCCNRPTNYKIAQAMFLRNLRRTVGVLDCLLPWLMLFRVNRRLMVSTLLWLIGYVVCMYRWIALME